MAALTLCLAAGCGSTNSAGSASPDPKTDNPGPASTTGSSSPQGLTSSAPATEEPTRETIPIKGSEYVRGRSTVLVNAPIAKVRKIATDYEKYPEFMPEHSNTRVLGRIRGGGHHIYMEIKIMSGTVRMWARLDAPKMPVVDGLETYEGFFKEGNVEDWKTIWRMRPVDDSHTELTLEVRIIPKFFVPLALMNDRNIEAAYQGVLAMKKRIEGMP
jgi:hypothetical protein